MESQISQVKARPGPLGVDPVEIILDSDPSPFDWEAIFGNSNRVEIEIGTGKGRFLIASAQSHPDVNFLGIDYSRKYLRMAAERMAKRGLTNVRVIRAEAREVVEKCVPDGSVGAFHIYFPDPWPKKRHHKRRLITAEFALLLPRKLLIGGEIRTVTDHAGYFEEIVSHFAASPLLGEAPFPVEEQCEGLTNYERKYVKEGRPIYRGRHLKNNE